ncbi:MAG TPA: carboxypeptidase regulatory-like domain-containing protein [Pyrinomonadaceae bacterium]|nr:carboxypeptidase regulatory-like domain-containing protein [Pyrinomonadaceae bacterium]
MPARMCFAVLVLLTIPAMVAACTCGLEPFPCGQSWKTGDVIFVGTVKSKVPLDKVEVQGSSILIDRGFSYYIQVTDSLRGPYLVGQEIVIETGGGGGDCGYPFIPGNEYLVYANGSQRLETNICTPTRPKVMAGAVIRQLRALRDKQPLDTLFGTIGIEPTGAGYEDLIETKTLANVTVRVIDSNKREYTTKTDSEGFYSFSSLPPDKYTIHVEFPAGFSLWQHDAGKPFTMEIKEGANCPVNLFARPDGRIAGTVVNPNGKGLAGFVTIKPEDPKEAEVASRRGGLPGYTTVDGTFKLMQLSPGRYRLLFYPKVGDRISFANVTYSRVIEIGIGQHVEDFQFTIERKK